MKQISEDHLSALSKRMVYPRTPDLVGPILSRIQKPPIRRSYTRRLLQTGMLVVILLVIFGFIPPVRAAILNFIQIGIVRIFVPVNDEQQSHPEITFTELPAVIPDRTGTAVSNLLLASDLEKIMGEMSLDQAQQRVGYPILLPTLPDQIGKPDRVFVQDTNGNMVILIWFENQNPELVRMSLHMVPEGSWVLEKFKPTILLETLVNGERAVWTEGPYPLIMRNGNVEFIRLVSGNVLIWTNAQVTLRLESNLPLDEAIQVAESLRLVE